jgi:hypothetical protein
VSVPQQHNRARRRSVFAVGTVLLLALAYGGIALAPDALAATNVLIKGAGSGRCLALPTSDGQTATIQDCASQRWTTASDGQIQSNGKCLDVWGHGTANGTLVSSWACSGLANQKWQVNADGTIVGTESGKCLDVGGENTAAGSAVWLWDCWGGTNQKWQLVGDGGTPGPTATTTPPAGGETVGTGDINNPAVGPGPSSSVFGSNFKLVKNWNFGASGTIKTIADMNREFYYHDQFGTIANGTNYGALTAAPDAANAISGQPINANVRQFTGDSVKTTLAPLNGATTVSPSQHNAVNGSFMAKWAPPNGGSRLGRDILWETRVRYVTPQEFWFALWNAGTQWDGGAEFDVVEAFGYDNRPQGGDTNFDGRYWHSDPVGGTSTTNYSNWSQGMASHGITSYDATQYHTWSLLYQTNNAYTFYVDGVAVQSGTMNWTLGGQATGTPIDFHFLFDAGWGHTQISSVNYAIPASEFNGKYYEFDWSHVYER